MTSLKINSLSIKLLYTRELIYVSIFIASQSRQNFSNGQMATRSFYAGPDDAAVRLCTKSRRLVGYFHIHLQDCHFHLPHHNCNQHNYTPSTVLPHFFHYGNSNSSYKTPGVRRRKSYSTNIWRKQLRRSKGR